MYTLVVVCLPPSTTAVRIYSGVYSTFCDHRPPRAAPPHSTSTRPHIHTYIEPHGQYEHSLLPPLAPRPVAFKKKNLGNSARALSSPSELYTVYTLGYSGTK